MDDIDLKPTVDMLVRLYGHDAVVVAARRARELLDQGEHEGGLLWVQIARAIGLSRGLLSETLM